VLLLLLLLLLLQCIKYMASFTTLGMYPRSPGAIDNQPNPSNELGSVKWSGD
jgi:hypothetical protein